jgi:hypothetical protein
LSLEPLEDRVALSLNTTLFELDGNTVNDPSVAGDDWDTLAAGGGSARAFTGVLADTPETTFKGGGSKDVNDLDQWKWGPGEVPRGADILNSYAAAYVADDELNVFLGQDRLATNGAGELGFWLFQQDIRLNADGTFRGTHTPGDILIEVGFKPGEDAGTVNVYQWDPTAPDNLRLLPSTDDVYGVTNSTPIDAAWRRGIPVNGFFEAGINLTSILNHTTEPDRDFTTFLAESRSSASLNSALQDFELGPIPLSTGPAIKIVKSVNGAGANAAPGPAVLAGTDVTFTYEVSNTGARALSNLQVIDDNGTPGNAGDDFSPHYVSGDDGNGVLDAGETWVYTATRPALVGPHASLATASGTDSRGRTVTDTDLAHYFGAQPALDVKAEVSVDGGTTWFDANDPSGPTLTAGHEAPLFKFVVANTGNTDLSDVTLNDSAFGPIPVPGTLAAGASVTAYKTGTWSAGQHTGTATAGGSFTDSAGNTEVRSASDSANYFGANPAIGVTEFVSVDGGTTWFDANSGTGPTLTAGHGAPLFKFVVANTGNTDLSDVTLNDSAFGPIPVPGTLAAGASVTAYKTGAWSAGQHTGTATAGGSFTDSAGNTEVRSASDSANYFGANPASDLSKEVPVNVTPTNSSVSNEVTPGSGGGVAFPGGVTPPTAGAFGSSDLVSKAAAGQSTDKEVAISFTGAAGNTDSTRGSDTANDSGAAPQFENPTLVVAVLVGPGAPGSARDLPLGGFVAGGLMPGPLLAAADGQRPGPLLGGGNGELASPEAEALPTTLAGRGRETVLPLQRTFFTSPGVAFVPEAETYGSLGERLAGAGKGAGENAPAPLHRAVEKALRLASSLADADDSVALIEAVTGPEAVSAGGPPPARPSPGVRGPAPQRREETEALAGARHWAWLAGAGGLAALLLVARRWWRGRRPRPVRGRRGEAPVASLSEDEVNHARSQ